MLKHIQRVSVYFFYLFCIVFILTVSGCKTAPPPPPVPTAPELISFGNSVEGRPIEGFVYKGENEKRDGVLFIASIHGDEGAGTDLLNRLNKYIKTLWKHQNQWQSRVVVIVPNVNPDGFSRKIRENVNGIDINHNFEGSDREPETAAILKAAAFIKNENVDTLRIISLRQLNSIDYDGPKAEFLARQIEKTCDLRIRSWGTSVGSLGWYGKKNDIPVITFGLPDERTVERRSLDENSLWKKYKDALITAVEYEFPDDEAPPSLPPRPLKENPEKNYIAGKSYLEKGKHDRAIREFKKVLRLDPQYKDTKKYLCRAYYEKGMILFESKDFIPAIKEFEQANKVHEGCEGASGKIAECKSRYRKMNFDQAMLHYNENRWNEAVKLFNKILAVVPNDTETLELKEKARAALGINANIKALISKGKNAFDNRRWDDAAAAFNDVLIIDPNHQEAREYLNKSEQEYVNYHYNLGVSFFDQEDEKNAVKEFEDVLKIAPDNTDALRMAEIAKHRLDGKKLFEERKYKEAVIEFETVLEKDKNDKVSRDHLDACYFMIGKGLFERQKFDEAEEAFNTAVKYNPVNQEALQYAAQSKGKKSQQLYDRAAALLKSKKWDQAVETLDKINSSDAAFARKINKAKNDAYLGKGKTLALQNKWDDALKSFDKIDSGYADYQKVKEAKNDVYYEKGNIYFSRNEWDQAVEAYLNVSGDYKDVKEKIKTARINKKYDAAYQRAVNFLNTQRCGEAVKAFEKIDQTFKDTKQKLKQAKTACYNLHFKEGETLLQREVYLDAVDEFKAAWEYKDRNPSDPCRQKIERCQIVLYRLGDKFYEKNQWDKAIVNFRKIYEIDSGYKDVKSKLNEIKSNLAIVQRLKEQEVQKLEALVKESPEDRSLQAKLGEAKADLKDIKALSASLPF